MPNGFGSTGVGPTASARVWNAATGEEVFRIGGHLRAVTIAAFSPDGKHIVTGSSFKLKLHEGLLHSTSRPEHV